jgi:Zn-dependent peptidase ImmA (M78 family)
VLYDRGRYQDKWRLERMAQAVRRQLGLDQYALLDPWQLAEAIPAHVFFPEDLVTGPLASAARRVQWDGFGFCYPDEPELMVLLNSARPKTRQVATLMEEFSHHMLKHRPSRLFLDPTTGLLRRDFDKAQEHEAYDFGSTLLLPKELVQREVKAGMTAHDLALERGCSVDYVLYRIKRCRLWNRYLVLNGSE